VAGRGLLAAARVPAAAAAGLLALGRRLLLLLPLPLLLLGGDFVPVLALTLLADAVLCSKLVDLVQDACCPALKKLTGQQL
jgi:hypothetical protein